MDPIKNQISAIDPLTIDPEPEPNGEEALHKILSGTRTFSDSPTIASVTSLENRRRRKAQIAGGLLLGAAAVTAGVLVAANLGSLRPTPVTAATVMAAEATPPASTSASATPTSSAAPAPTVPAVAPTTPPPVAAPQKFTFPDGHLSFTLPVGWSVRTEQGPYLSEAARAGSVGAVVLDSAGSEVARVSSGMYGDGAAGMVDRTVLDRAIVPGIADKSGNTVEFGFFSYQVQYVPYDGPAYEGMPPALSGPVDEPPYYAMDVRLSSQLETGITTSGTNQIAVSNGMMNAYVVFDAAKRPTFDTPEAAKAWMGSAQYTRLKSLLLSLSYQ
jgi:hypothetical protein